MSDETHRTLIVLAFDLTSQIELQQIIEQIALLNLPVTIGANHIVIEELAQEVEKLINKGSDYIGDTTFYNEETIFKVNKALRVSGLTQVQTQDAINEMQNAGILFRERL